MQKKIGRYWFSLGRKTGFGIGFDIDQYGWYANIGFWYIGQEF